MSSSIKSWSTVVIALGAMALAAFAPAQTQNFPTQKGGNQRQGNNGSPQTDNPGVAQLVWFQPNGAASATSTETNASIFASFTGAWLAPILSATPSPLITHSNTFNITLDAQVGINIFTPYLYTGLIPCAKNGNVLQGLGSPPSVFTWTYNNNGNPLGNTANDYALYVNIPGGPTVDASGFYHYPPQYYVFQINYGTGLTFIDIVDTHVSGYGLVRLGSGGAANNTLFHYDGVNPIQISLYNTVPRNSAGVLQGVNLDSAGNIANAPVVYANATQVVPNIGSFISSPILGTDTLGNTRVFAATNTNVVTQQNGVTATQTKGLLASYAYNSGALNWTYSPADQGSIGITMALSSAGVSQTAGWTSGLTTPLTGFSGYIGSNYLYETVTNIAAAADVVTYAPTLADGTYDVKLWLPGPVNPSVPGYPVFAQNVQVEVDQGTNVSTFTVDLTQTNGYVSVSPGNRFTNTQAAPLVVKISNYSAAAGDAGKLGFANAVRFVGAENLAVTSTPAHATVPISYTYFDPNTNKKVTVTQAKSVVVLCAEDGHIYCLDATGRGDGTTDIYWAYPSLPDPTNPAWTDPNNNSAPGAVPTAPDGSNNVTVAQMPTGFSLSSPLIQEVPPGSGNFFLYVAANNGRVYCLDMKGRGDNYIDTRSPGTTTRIWTFPNDYRPDSPTTPSTPSALGATNASLVYNTNTAGPTIFVPSAQGRIYALDALGNAAQTTTTASWEYPAATAQTVGAFNSTPALDGPAGAETLFAGTERKNGNQAGQFFAINAETGAVNWVFQDTNPATATDDFESGPATAFNGLADGILASQYVFVANSNGYVYALDNTNNGAVIWKTNEIGATVSAPLMFTYMTVYGNNRLPTPTPVPVVEVPDDAGRFNALFAAGNPLSTYPTVNLLNGKFAGGYVADGDVLYAGTASGHTYMYGADNHGYLYGFANGNGVIGGGIAGPGNGGSYESPNDPDATDYATAKIGFLTSATYTALRYPIAGTPDYNTYTSAGNFINRVPPAFDFGETLYVILYNYPFKGANARTSSVSFTFTAQGRTIRGQLVPSQQFAGAPVGPNGLTEDGYAVYAFPLQPSGGQMMAPGSGTVSTSIQTTGPSGGRVYMFGNPGTQQIAFTIANPLGIAMKLNNNSYYGVTQDSLGADAASFGNPADPQNAFNGSVAYAGLGWDPSLLYTGQDAVAGRRASDGQSAPTQTVYAYDRSLMELLNGPDNVTSNDNTSGVAGSIAIRVDRGNAAWLGGYNAVVQPMGGPSGLYGGGVPLLEMWEDYPSQYPNVSLDYPDILAEFVNVTSFPTTIAGNPLFSPVTLPNPIGVLDANGKPVANPQNRTPNPMPIAIDTSVPQFQPANLNLVQDIDGGGGNIFGGYSSPMDVFIDPNGSGKLSLNGNQRSAYRSFTYMLGVEARQHISLLTPNLDLGALPQAAGLLPANGVTLPSVLSPWADLISTPHLYGSFQAVNDGNVNLRDVRLAKATNTATSGYFGWPFYASANDDLSYLDGSLYLWSDLDAYQNGGAPLGFSPSLTANGGPLSRGEVIAEKPRTTAVSGTRISPNPVNLPNGILGTAGGTPMNPAYPINRDPHIGVTPPVGMPVGTYSNIVRLIEDDNNDLSLLLGTSPGTGEPYSDPTLSLSFTVRESKLTNSPSPYDHTMVDNLLPGGATNSLDSNIEPTGMRDRAFGNLFFAWASNRTALNNGALANGDFSYRIYGSSLAGSQPAGTGSPLNELAVFKAANVNQWFGAAGPYPFGASVGNVGAVNAAFGVAGPDHVVGTVGGEEDTVRFGEPSLPGAGLLNPFVVGDATGATDFGHAIMAFTGSATVQTATGRVSVNRLFATTVQPNVNAAATIGAPIASANDPDLPKGRPSVAQVGPDQAVIFYGEGSGGRSRLYYSLFDASTGTFSQTTPIDTGVGFDSVSDPSAEARLYQGVDAADVAQTQHMIELSFSGRLRGRPNSEIFLARIPTDANGAPNASNSNKEMLSYFSTRFVEQLELQGGGIYRAVGVGWNPVQGDPIRSIDIGLGTGVGAPQSIINPGSPRLYDSQSGILTLQTSLGLVYVDTFQGTVRFANTQPGTNYHVFATYQPKFLRLSVSKTAGLSGPVLLWDDRHVGSSNYDPVTFQMFDRYWYVGNAHANLANQQLLNNRYFVMYNRAAAGTGQSARPMMETLRLGVQLPGLSSGSTGTVIPTLASGDVDFGRFSVGTSNPYQVDPATGRVYFTAADEDANVTITVNGVPNIYRVGLIPELSETPIRIDQPIHEGHVVAFVDPFDSAGVNTRRPDLVWLLWTSTRTGTSDVYFETIAPVLWPTLK